jgi:hypothetical protein
VATTANTPSGCCVESLLASAPDPRANFGSIRIQLLNVIPTRESDLLNLIVNRAHPLIDAVGFLNNEDMFGMRGVSIQGLPIFEREHQGHIKGALFMQDILPHFTFNNAGDLGGEIPEHPDEILSSFH